LFSLIFIALQNVGVISAAPYIKKGSHNNNFGWYLPTSPIPKNFHSTTTSAGKSLNRIRCKY